MNPFDAAILGLAIIALVTGFSSGLLRSLATILAYLVAVPVALAVSPSAIAWLGTQRFLPPDQMQLLVSVTPFLILVIIAMVLGALMRGAVSGVTGGHMVLADRTLGAVLGVLRIGLVAVAFVLILERMVPVGREPDWLKGSQLRPYLSAAGAQGLRALPLQALDYIDRFKRERGL
jgi:membrane protein required for colicin V production